MIIVKPEITPSSKRLRRQPLTRILTLIILALLMVIIYLSWQLLQVANKPSPTVSLDTSFPDAARTEFTTVARDVAEVMRGIFGQSPVDKRPIVCFAEANTVPLTDATSDPAIIWIRLALAKDDFDRMDYSRFAYQLSHELAHVYLNPLRTNGMIETLCDAASYEALNRLSDLWSTTYAHYPLRKIYAQNFKSYANKSHKLYIAILPSEILNADGEGRWEVVTAYLKSRQADLDSSIYSPLALALRSLGASALRSGEVPWKDLIDLAARTDPSPKEHPRFRDNLPTEFSSTSGRVRAALRRIGRG